MHKVIDTEPRHLSPNIAIGSKEFMEFLIGVDEVLADGYSSWRNDSIEKRGGSAIEGLGLFATTDIGPRELLAVKGGRVVNEEEVRRLTAEGILHGSQQQIGLDTFLVGLTHEEEDKNMVGYNHSCDPNAFFAWTRTNASLFGTALLLSRIAIDAGEEVTTDYSVSHISNTHRFICNCGSPNCRVVIQPRYDYMHPEFQERYKAEFPPYMQELIDDLDGKFKDRKGDVLYSAYFGETVGRITVLQDEIQRLRGSDSRDKSATPRLAVLSGLLVEAETYLLLHYPDVAQTLGIDTSGSNAFAKKLSERQNEVVAFAKEHDEKVNWMVEK